MDLDFTSEEEMLRDSAARFLSTECPYERVKEIEESAEGYDPKLWQQVIELGWTGLLFPEEYGGYGGQFMDLVIIMEEMGKMVFPSPFFSTIVQCGLAILEGGTEEQKVDLLGKISEGSLIMALAQYEDDGSWEPASLSMKADPQGDDYVLNGTKMFVMDANIADSLIVAAHAGDKGLSLFVVDTKADGITINKMPTISMDNTCEVLFADVKVSGDSVLGEPGNGIETLEKMTSKAMVAKAAQMIGGARVCIDITADYAREREQYGKPIGGYQIIQHYMANMLLTYDTTSNYLYRVTSMVDEGQAFDIDAMALKAAANEAFDFIAERSVQIHGGIGTTREANIGLFYRRSKSYESILGGTAYHFEKIADKIMAEGLSV